MSLFSKKNFFISELSKKYVYKYISFQDLGVQFVVSLFQRKLKCLKLNIMRFYGKVNDSVKER